VPSRHGIVLVERGKASKIPGPGREKREDRMIKSLLHQLRALETLQAGFFD